MGRVWLSALRVSLAVAAVFALLWWFGVRMPGKNLSHAAPLSPEEIVLRTELQSDVQKLAGDIGERNILRYPALDAAARWIERSFADLGLRPRRDTYELRGQACHNIEAEIPGSSSEIVLVGAHYDSVVGCPGANDNASGVAAMLALARRFSKKQGAATLRFVAFVNEEPPFFQTPEMGSFVYASRCKARGDRIKAMISLETIGYFSDAPHSQTYPSIGLGVFYPKTGNFIGFVGNLGSRGLVRRVVRNFRAAGSNPFTRRGAARLYSGSIVVRPMVFLGARLSGADGNRHGAVSLFSLSRAKRYSGQARLRSIRSGCQRDGKSDRRPYRRAALGRQTKGAITSWVPQPPSARADEMKTDNPRKPRWRRTPDPWEKTQPT